MQKSKIYLFQGKGVTVDGIWHRGSLWQQEGVSYIQGQNNQGIDWRYEVDTDTVGQYVNRDDIVGDPIFEGDLIHAVLPEWVTEYMDEEGKDIYYPEKHIIGEVVVRVSGGLGMKIRAIITCMIEGCPEPPDKDDNKIIGSFIRIKNRDKIIGNIHESKIEELAAVILSNIKKGEPDAKD